MTFVKRAGVKRGVNDRYERDEKKKNRRRSVC